MRSEYFPTFQCTKRVKINLLIPLKKFKKDTFKLFLHIYRSQNMQKKCFKIVKCMHAHKHIMLSIVWLEYFYSPQSKSGVTIFKDIKTKRARDLK